MSCTRVLQTPRLRGLQSRFLWARGLFGGRDRPRESQSKVLSGEDGPLFSMEVTRLHPEYMDDYVKLSGEQMMRISESDDYPAKLVGAWRTMIGPAKDQTTHIWQHTGYNSIMETQQLLNKDKLWLEYRSKRNKMVQKRSNQIVLPFTFWDDVAGSSQKKKTKGLYEMRTYTLRPGTLIEWGQAWESGIQYRRDEAVGGWFSQIGEMHQVHHLWGKGLPVGEDQRHSYLTYKDLADRQKTRQAAWEFPGWDECVVKTVPLIRYMVVRILTPLSYSPLQ